MKSIGRRNFFKALSSAVVGTYIACQIKLPETSELISEINPAWITAPYEVAFSSFYYATNIDVAKKAAAIKMNEDLEIVPMCKDEPLMIPIIYKRLKS